MSSPSSIVQSFALPDFTFTYRIAREENGVFCHPPPSFPTPVAGGACFWCYAPGSCDTKSDGSFGVFCNVPGCRRQQPFSVKCSGCETIFSSLWLNVPPERVALFGAYCSRACGDHNTERLGAALSDPPSWTWDDARAICAERSVHPPVEVVLSPPMETVSSPSPDANTDQESNAPVQNRDEFRTWAESFIVPPNWYTPVAIFNATALHVSNRQLLASNRYMASVVVTPSDRKWLLANGLPLDNISPPIVRKKDGAKRYLVLFYHTNYKFLRSLQDGTLIYFACKESDGNRVKLFLRPLLNATMGNYDGEDEESPKVAATAPSTPIKKNIKQAVKRTREAKEDKPRADQSKQLKVTYIDLLKDDSQSEEAVRKLLIGKQAEKIAKHTNLLKRDVEQFLGKDDIGIIGNWVLIPFKTDEQVERFLALADGLNNKTTGRSDHIGMFSLWHTSLVTLTAAAVLDFDTVCTVMEAQKAESNQLSALMTLTDMPYQMLQEARSIAQQSGICTRDGWIFAQLRSEEERQRLIRSGVTERELFGLLFVSNFEERAHSIVQQFKSCDGKDLRSVQMELLCDSSLASDARLIAQPDANGNYAFIVTISKEDYYQLNDAGIEQKHFTANGTWITVPCGRDSKTAYDRCCYFTSIPIRRDALSYLISLFKGSNELTPTVVVGSALDEDANNVNALSRSMDTTTATTATIPTVVASIEFNFGPQPMDDADDDLVLSHFEDLVCDAHDAKHAPFADAIMSLSEGNALAMF